MAESFEQTLLAELESLKKRSLQDEVFSDEELKILLLSALLEEGVEQ